MARSGLRLRTARRFEDFANKITLLLWESLLGEKDFSRSDPHRFPRLAQALKRVLQGRVGACLAGAPAGQTEINPSCREHERRLREEFGNELTGLRGELEKETLDFLSRRDPGRSAFQPSLAEKVHGATEAIVPYLCENIACSCCDGLAKG